jgi:hypothetical protein
MNRIDLSPVSLRPGGPLSSAFLSDTKWSFDHEQIRQQIPSNLEKIFGTSPRQELDTALTALAADLASMILRPFVHRHQHRPHTAS